MRAWGGWVLAAAFAAGAGKAMAGEKLLLGFEKEELRARAEKHKKDYRGGFYFEEKGEEVLFLDKSWGYGDWVPKKPYVAHRGRASQGEHALKAVLPVRDTAEGRLRLPDGHVLREPAVFGTYGNWHCGTHFHCFFPADWSGHALLRMDVLLERNETKAPAPVFLDLGDDERLPPVRRSYTLPPGQWVTLEADLERIARERSLAVERMALLLLSLGSRQKAKNRSSSNPETLTVWLDNLRLSPRDAKARFPVLRDESPLEVEFPRSFAFEYDPVKDERGRVQLFMKLAAMDMPEPAEIEPAPAPEKLGPPAVIDLTKYKELNIKELEQLSLGEELAALDAQRVLVPFRCSLYKRKPWFPAHDVGVTYVLGTTDGGATWKGLDGEPRPFPFAVSHHRPGFCVALDGEFFVFSNFGCQNTGWSYPVDKGFVRRTVATKDGWWLSPQCFVDSQGQHCVDGQTAARTKSGRLWTVWSHVGLGRGELCARYSDDGGRTWQTPNGPGRHPRVPGMSPGNFYHVAPYGEHVAVLVRHHHGKATWTRFDGKSWSKPEDFPSPYGQTVVSVGGKELVLAAMEGVWAWDGRAWKKELELKALRDKSAPFPRLAVSGRSVLLFALDATGKKLLCWRRLGGAWKGPEELASEETAVTGLATQRYAPEGFAPVAWVCRESEEVSKKLIAGGAHPRHVRAYKPWIKLLKVPAGE